MHFELFYIRRNETTDEAKTETTAVPVADWEIAPGHIASSRPPVWPQPGTATQTPAPWLSWLKRLSSKQEIPSLNLGGASLFFSPYCLNLDLSCTYILLLTCQPG